MDQLISSDTTSDLDKIHANDLEQFVTFVVNGQLFGVPVLQVQDILRTEDIARVPLAPPEVRGSINLRGRIVTVIDVRIRLGLPKAEDNQQGMGVTVEQQNDLYTLLVDEIGEVLSLPSTDREKVPGTLNPAWRDFACGIFQLEKQLMVVLDIDRLLRKHSATNTGNGAPN